MSIQDLDLVVLHCGFDINIKPNVSSMSVTKVSFSFFFNSILKSLANIMGIMAQLNILPKILERMFPNE
jgi:acetoin utilization deacetylase AcuC-like enzyme